MRTFVVILALAAVAAADVSHIVRPADASATIVSQDADVLPDSFQYAYETSNGIKGEEQGVLKNLGPDGDAISVQGKSSYINDAGQLITLLYSADENGFQAKGDHLPTPPPAEPIPDYIARAIEYIRTHPPKPEPGSKF